MALVLNCCVPLCGIQAAVPKCPDAALAKMLGVVEGADLGGDRSMSADVLVEVLTEADVVSMALGPFLTPVVVKALQKAKDQAGSATGGSVEVRGSFLW